MLKSVLHNLCSVKTGLTHALLAFRGIGVCVANAAFVVFMYIQIGTEQAMQLKIPEDQQNVQFKIPRGLLWGPGSCSLQISDGDLQGRFENRQQCFYFQLFEHVRII